MAREGEDLGRRKRKEGGVESTGVKMRSERVSMLVGRIARARQSKMNM